MALTAHGQQFHSVAQNSLEQFDAVADWRVGYEGQPVAIDRPPPLVAANILPQAIKEFREHHGQPLIQVFEGDPPTIKKKVQAGKLDMALGAFLKGTAGLRRTPFFRFTLMVIREDKDPAFRPASTTRSALKGPLLVSLPPSNPTQQLINRRLAANRGRIRAQRCLQIPRHCDRDVEAGEGIAIIPSFATRSCNHRKVVVCRLTSPVVNLNFYQITNRGKKLPDGAGAFTSFLKSYIARWAGYAGIL